MDAVSSPEQIAPRSGALWRIRWAMPFAFVLAGLAVSPIDVAVASVFKEERSFAVLDHQLREALEICEAFGHGFGATLIVIAVVVLDPLKRRCLPWLFAGSLGSGLVANLMKLLVHRTRPRDFDLATGTVWDTFVRGNGDFGGMQSFPSAHTATATGLAIVLAALYPQGRWLFSILALLVGIQRIATLAHFPSDVCIGAAVGCAVGMVCVTSMTSHCGMRQPSAT